MSADTSIIGFADGSESERLIEVLDGRVRRRENRRAFFTAAFGAAAIGGAFAYASSVAAQTPPSDADVLNFALNLEYLEAQFYLYATTGAGLAAADTTSGADAAGGTVIATGVPSGGVDFSGDPLVGAYAKEIAADELAHVRFLRDQLKTARVAMPNIDISGAANGAFSKAAFKTGITTSAATPFNPYASPNAFLLGAFIFEDVGVTAYKGAAPLLRSPTYLEAAAGILAVEAYHASIVRTTLYARGIATPSAMLIETVGKISDGRDALDNLPSNPTADPIKGIAAEDDQGIAETTSTFGGNQSNIVPLNENGLAYSRTTSQVLNIVYLGDGATAGGFFPNGVNGTIKAVA